MLTSFETRYKTLQAHLAPIVKKVGLGFMEAREYGIKECLQPLEWLKIMNMGILLREWQAMKQNTFHLQYDDNGCPIYIYPSDLPESDIYGLCKDKDMPKCCDCTQHTKTLGGGYIGLFSCADFDIEYGLRAYGIYPKGNRPDGISYMIINDNTSTPCNPPNPFQVNKTRNGV